MPKIPRSLASLLLFTSVVGCDVDEPARDAPLEVVEFNAHEVAAEIAANPEATFSIDLRRPVRYRFDQSTAPLAWDRFFIQTRHADEPRPLIHFADEVGIALDRSGFTLEPAERDVEGFRQLEDCVLDCWPPYGTPVYCLYICTPTGDDEL